MTIAIDPKNVSAILLADGWHEVVPETLTFEELAYAGPHVTAYGESTASSSPVSRRSLAARPF